MNTNRQTGLVSWQWAHYAKGHQDRRNLVVHALTTPLFWAGTWSFPVGIILRSGWAAVAGLLAMVVAIAAQGRTHRREATAPLPFRGPADVLLRHFVEQWITFPRYVITGEFARAWRG